MAESVVEVAEGKLKGNLLRTVNNFEYYSFIGIPYAKPPIGGLRFTEPQPPERWEGIKDATEQCNICAQYDKATQTVVGDEDCLYLNVYTPKLPPSVNTPLPVMVFLHGGGFVFGCGTDPLTHGPDYLITKDVLLVTINYRLGVLGFLSLDLKDAPGNMGLKDQVQALKWIKKNIDKFGGNPDNVTIFGISAGGASVEYLMISPMAKGLFHKAIAQSGSSLLHWAHNDKDKIKLLALAIAKFSGTVIDDNVSLLNFLKSLSTKELIELSMKALGADAFKGGIHFGYVPTIEKSGDWEPFLDKSTYEVLCKGEFNKVPFMTGFCQREGLLTVSFAAPTLAKLKEEKKFFDHFPFDLDSAEIADVETQLKTIYLAGANKSKDGDEFAIDFFTDVDFLGGIYVAAKLIAKHTSPVYLYEFSYDGTLNYVKKILSIDRDGAAHGDDGGYLLRCDKLSNILTKDDVQVQNVMITAWTNFAKYGSGFLALWPQAHLMLSGDVFQDGGHANSSEGTLYQVQLPEHTYRNPTPESDEVVPIKWEPMSQMSTVCFVIDKEVYMKNENEIYPERMNIYEDTFNKKYTTKN